MNQHQDHLITQGLGAGNEVDFGRMGIDRFKAEAEAPQQQGFTLLLSQQGRLKPMGFRGIWRDEFGEVVGIHKGKTQRLQKQPVKGAFAGAIAAHQQPELFARNHELAQPGSGSEGMKMPLRKLPVVRLPLAAMRSKAPGWLAEAW